MSTGEFTTILLSRLPFMANLSQRELFNQLASFVLDKSDNPSLFILKGFAGTGKTSIISALVNSLPSVKIKSVLLAPTGRAAKVLAEYSKIQAFTIHKKIYRRIDEGQGSGNYILQTNAHKNTLFIIDEASMIASHSNLLDDLIAFVFQGFNCKLIMVGDSAQLPPVNSSHSPALDVQYLKHSFNLSIQTTELTEVVRQTEDSGVLFNATKIREEISSLSTEKVHLKLCMHPFKDIISITGVDLEDALNEAYGKHGVEDTIVICRSNKRANLFNQQIRSRIRWQESEISTGDYMMVVKNNYFWLPSSSRAGFIANGDTIELLKVGNVKELYGFRFVNARIRLVDYPEEPILEVNLMLDTIMTQSSALSEHDNKKLYHAVLEDYMDITNKGLRYQKMKKDPYLNALQVKFAYAVTCHKAQGGQWRTVFLDQGYLTKDMVNVDFLRWLYTGVTRATEKLYLVNFNQDFFE